MTACDAGGIDPDEPGMVIGTLAGFMAQVTLVIFPGVDGASNLLLTLGSAPVGLLTNI